MLPAAPGDVLAVSAGPWWARQLIEAGERLRGLACPVDHVVIVTHQDRVGRWIGIQGQPGGVALADCTPYLSAPVTRSNHGQPKPAAGSPEMTVFLASCAKSLGIGYDWAGIAEDGLDALHLHDLAGLVNRLWAWPANRMLLPGHLVCSSLAANLYEIADWPHPSMDTERQCEPADWWRWNDRQMWKLAPPPAGKQ
jgi:hypothetical protein